MKRLMVLIPLIILPVFIFAAGQGEKANQLKAVPEKAEKIVLSTPVATISLPLIYIIKNNLLKDYAKEVELSIWSSNDQFRTQVISGNVDFVTMPVNAACLFYNKGIPLKMLKIAMWKLFYIVSRDNSIQTISDLKGKKIVMPFRGEVNDILFRYLCERQKVEPGKDIAIEYVPSLLDTAASIIGGQADYALMIEPGASLAFIKAKEKNIVLNRAIDIQVEWSRVTGIAGNKLPISGVAATPRILRYPATVKAFAEAYDEGVEWAINNPDEATRLAVKYLEGINAEALKESLKYVNFESKSTGAVQSEIVEMFSAFLKIDAGSIGGKLPDASFYYQE